MMRDLLQRDLEVPTGRFGIFLKNMNGELVVCIRVIGVDLKNTLELETGFVGALDWDPNVAEGVLFGAVPIAASATVLWGLRISRQSPRLGPGLVAIATVAMAAVWFWLAFILAPAAIVVIAFAFTRARRLAGENNNFVVAC